jgi:hypothetical protein
MVQNRSWPEAAFSSGCTDFNIIAGHVLSTPASGYKKRYYLIRAYPSAYVLSV